MRIALLSYSHHGRGMASTTRDLGHEIVAVMDAEQGPRQQLADEFSCPAYSSAGECLDASRPDAALVAGRHTEMPQHVLACAQREIPFLLDKPFADCAARMRPAADLCAERGVFSAMTLPNRATYLVALVQQMIDDGSFGDLVLYNSRLNNGPPARYDPTPSACMAQRPGNLRRRLLGDRVGARNRHLLAICRGQTCQRGRQRHLQHDVRA